MLARFSAASGISKRCFGLDLALLVPGLSRAESKAYEFFHSPRARIRACERSTYAVPQILGVFVIKVLKLIAPLALSLLAGTAPDACARGHGHSIVINLL